MMKVPGSLLVLGDLNNAITVSVSRVRLADYKLLDLKPEDLTASDAQAKLTSALLDQLAAEKGLFSLNVLDTQPRTGPDGRVYVDLEFESSFCKGDIVEGARGRRR